MRPLSAHDILQVWERGQGQHPVDRALTLLAAGCPDMTWEALAGLTIGQRDARLLTLREQTFGATMQSWTTCPRCAERLEFSIAVSDIRVTTQPDDGPQHGELDLEDLVLQVRPPTSVDLIAVARCESAEGGRDVLVQRCVLQANRDGIAVTCSELPGEALTRLAAYLADCDPQAEVLLDLTCPACRYHWQIMSSSTDNANLDPCGCCDTDAEASVPENRPGQSTLTYRIGTHSSFLRRMLAQLSRETIPDGDNQGTRPLATLTSRAPTDPAIALLDAWATVADVLTFYQERIANEGSLRTATERRSVLELARAIGYELSPGVAAGMYLAFTVEDVEGTPGKATIPAGTRVQSVPVAQGEIPQTFETMEAFAAQAVWNALQPRRTWPQRLTATVSVIHLEGSTTNLTHLYLQGTSTNLKAGDLLLLVHIEARDTVTITVTNAKPILHIETDNDQTRVDFAVELETPIFPKEARPDGAVGLGRLEFNADNINEYVLGQTWTESNLQLFLSVNGWDADDLLAYVDSYQSPAEESDSEGVFALRQQVGFFGHNAPRWETTPDQTHSRGNPDPYLNSWEGMTIWTDSQGTSYNNDATQDTPHVYLERSLPGLMGDSWAVFDGFVEEDQTGAIQRRVYRVNNASEATIADYGLSAKATGLKLLEISGANLPASYTDQPQFLVRKTTAYVQSEKLELADYRIETPLNTGDTDLELNSMVLGLQKGQALALSGERHDATGVYQSEILTLDEITHSGGFTTLHFTMGLQYSYVRDTVTLNANVVKATHGETVQEVLGSGDGSQASQQFVLQKSPLTYVSAATPSGGESTLAIRVNDVLWQEASTLYGLDATNESYMVRIANDGTARVTFGDGKRGTRLPSGQSNIVATYRTGTGEDGEVDAGSLTLLATRPLGIKAVTNPLAASGAANPEALEDAQLNAPRTVLTLDRIVSLQDVEDFAHTFAGIG